MDFDQFFNATAYNFTRAQRTSDKPIPVPIDEVIVIVAKHAGTLAEKLIQYELGRSLIKDYRSRDKDKKSYDATVTKYFGTIDKDIVQAVHRNHYAVPHDAVERRINEHQRALETARQCMSALSTLVDNKVTDVDIYKIDKGMKKDFLKAVGIVEMGVRFFDLGIEREAQENVMLQIIRQATKYPKKNEPQPKAQAA